MTGNTVLLGLALAAHDFARAGAVLWPILSFVIGSGAGLALAARSPGLALAAEAAALFIAGFTEERTVQLEVLAFAMGVQNASLTKFSGIAANTAFITGNYQKLAQAVLDLFKRATNGEARRSLVLMSALIGSYALGAILVGLVTQAGAHHELAFLALIPLAVAYAVRRRSSVAP
jgi:uncharacterized membrane protein YoaK (UPF0700 family)